MKNHSAQIKFFCWEWGKPWKNIDSYGRKHGDEKPSSSKRRKRREYRESMSWVKPKPPEPTPEPEKPKHICAICRDEFESKEDLDEHIKINHMLRKYTIYIRI